jgi:hypothetical protein
MVESSLVMYKNDIVDYNYGTASSVEFNFERLWMLRRKEGEYFKPFMLEFYHVHPKGFCQLSDLDKNCMKGLAQAFGSDIYFSIVLFKNVSLFNTDCTQKAFYYDRKTKEIKKATLEPLNDNKLLFLKYLSYGEGGKD